MIVSTHATQARRPRFRPDGPSFNAARVVAGWEVRRPARPAPVEHRPAPQPAAPPAEPEEYERWDGLA